MASSSSRDLERRLHALDPWFHNLVLDGVPTAPDHFLGDYPAQKFQRFAPMLPADLTGKTVLDVGCNAGFCAFEMKRRGAAHVVAIDPDSRYLASECPEIELVVAPRGRDERVRRGGLHAQDPHARNRIAERGERRGRIELTGDVEFEAERHLLVIAERRGSAREEEVMSIVISGGVAGSAIFASAEHPAPSAIGAWS